MQELRQAIRAAYDDIELPAELHDSLRFLLRRAPRRRRLLRRASVMAATLLCALVLALNAMPAFALAAADVPVLGPLCRMFTFARRSTSDGYKHMEITIPRLSGTGNSSLEDRVNLEIARLMSEAADEAAARAEEYFTAYLATGGDPDLYHPMEIVLDYEVKSLTEERASFVLSRFESLASAYETSYYYNLDLTTGRNLTLRDLLGSDYVALVTQEVSHQIDEREDELGLYIFDEVSIASLIDDNRPFYLDEEGNVVVVFEKYEIAAGAAGRLAFPVAAVAEGEV